MQQQQPPPKLPDLALSHVFNFTVDKMSEDLKTLQNQCWKSPSDTDRQRKIIDYCELQRHHALQLLALLTYAEKEAPFRTRARESVSIPLELLWTRRSAAWNPNFASPEMHPYSLTLAVDVFRQARAPKFDVLGAMGLFSSYTKATPGFELLRDQLNAEEANRRVPSAEETTQRVWSKILSEEIRFDTPKRQRMIVDKETGHLVVNSQGYVVHLSLDDTEWYPTKVCLLVQVDKTNMSKEEEVDEELRISLKWGDYLCTQLEQHVQRKRAQQQQQLDVVSRVEEFMDTLCVSLALQVWERQAVKLGYVSELDANKNALKIRLNFGEYDLLISQQTRGGVESRSLFAFTLQQQQGLLFTSTLNDVDVNLTQLNLRSVLASALKEASRATLFQKRKEILLLDRRHDESQVRMRGSKLEMDLFADESVLWLECVEGKYVLSTNSLAIRFGQFSIAQYFSKRQAELEAFPQNNGELLLNMWNELEAWDCLSRLSVPTCRASYEPPCLELVSKITPLPSLFFGLGTFEALFYVLVVQFQQGPSAFHTKFLRQSIRIQRSVSYFLASVGKNAKGESTVLNTKRDFPLFTEEEGTVAIPPNLVLDMRRDFVHGVLKERFRLTLDESNDEFHGSSLSCMQCFEPFRLSLLPDGGVHFVSNNSTTTALSLTLKRHEEVGVRFHQWLKTRLLLTEIASQLPADFNDVKRGTQSVVVMLKNMALFKAVRFHMDEPTYRLRIDCVPTAHPLEANLARLCETQISLAVSILQDSMHVMQACSKYAIKHNKVFRCSASSVANMHFVFEPAERQTFDCRFLGFNKISVWNRVGWGNSAMMNDTSITKSDTPTLHTLVAILTSL